MVDRLPPRSAAELVEVAAVGGPAMTVIRSLISAAAVLLDPLCRPGAKTCARSGICEIAPGKHANLVAVAGDPLKGITELEWVTLVIKAGVVWKAP